MPKNIELTILLINQKRYRSWLIARKNNYHNSIISIVSIAEKYSQLGHYRQALKIIKKTSNSYNKITSSINMVKISAKSQQPVDQ